MEPVCTISLTGKSYAYLVSGARGSDSGFILPGISLEVMKGLSPIQIQSPR